MSNIKTSAIIPAFNEAYTVAKVVYTVLKDVDEVIVVDSCSNDNTALEAKNAGARVIRANAPGKHHAIRSGIIAARGEELIFIDADFENPPLRIAHDLISALRHNSKASISKGYFKIPFGNDADGGGRLTELCARPLLALFFPKLSFVRQPLSGEFAVYRKDILDCEFAPGFAVDLGILLHCSKKGKVVQVDLGSKMHKHRSLISLGQAAMEVEASVLRASGLMYKSANLEQYKDGRIIRSNINLEPLSPIKDSIRKKSNHISVKTRKENKIEFPRIFYSFSLREKEVLRSIVSKIYELDDIICLIWGGSTTYIEKKKYFTDVDFWLITNNVHKIKKNILCNFKNIKGLSFIYNAGYFPWLGELLSLYFYKDWFFSIDIGVCNMNDISTINTGPYPFIVFGESSEVEARLRYQKYIRLPEQRVACIQVNLLKIRKSLLSGYYWNAIEYLNRARREFMGLIALNSKKKEIYYSRPDRNIESVINSAELSELIYSCPEYSTYSISKCALIIAQECILWVQKNKLNLKFLIEIKSLRDWYVKYSGNLMDNQ